MATEFKEIESRLWKVADSLRANSGLKASEYSTPVLGLIFLKYADQRFREAQARLEAAYPGMELSRDDFQEEGVLYLREAARFDTLLRLPESADIGQAVNDAMRAIEEDNEDLRGTLPKNYRSIANSKRTVLGETIACRSSTPLPAEFMNRSCTPIWIPRTSSTIQFCSY